MITQSDSVYKHSQEEALHFYVIPISNFVAHSKFDVYNVNEGQKLILQLPMMRTLCSGEIYVAQSTLNVTFGDSKISNTHISVKLHALRHALSYKDG